jgi:hypothetical protein
MVYNILSWVYVRVINFERLNFGLVHRLCVQALIWIFTLTELLNENLFLTVLLTLFFLRFAIDELIHIFSLFIEPLQEIIDFLIFFWKFKRINLNIDRASLSFYHFWRSSGFIWRLCVVCLFRRMYRWKLFLRLIYHFVVGRNCLGKFDDWLFTVNHLLP